MIFRLAHVSDPHLGPMPRPSVRSLLGKRAIGYFNWQINRRRVHDQEVLAALVADVHAHAPDHIALTGDLVNIALSEEFTHAQRFLARLGRPEDVSLVPGNHDAYVRSKAHGALSFWPDYVRGDHGQAIFPYVRVRGAVALIGVSTAVPTGPLMASGKIGFDQLLRLEEVLVSLRAKGLFRVVMIHHPPFRLHPQKGLRDVAALTRVLCDAGAEMILHGHEHVRSLHSVAGGIPAYGVPSASGNGTHGEVAGWMLHEISLEGDKWQVKSVYRGWSSLQQGFETFE